jgi:hypothetical protein
VFVVIRDILAVMMIMTAQAIWEAGIPATLTVIIAFTVQQQLIVHPAVLHLT